MQTLSMKHTTLAWECDYMAWVIKVFCIDIKFKKNLKTLINACIYLYFSKNKKKYLVLLKYIYIRVFSVVIMLIGMMNLLIQSWYQIEFLFLR